MRQGSTVTKTSAFDESIVANGLRGGAEREDLRMRGWIDRVDGTVVRPSDDHRTDRYFAGGAGRGGFSKRQLSGGMG